MIEKNKLQTKIPLQVLNLEEEDVIANYDEHGKLINSIIDISKIKKQIKNELLLIKNESTGLHIELQSSQKTLDELLNVAFTIQHNFFKKNDSTNTYLG